MSVEQRLRVSTRRKLPADLDEIIALSDRIAVLFDGRVMGTLPARGAAPEEIGLLMAGVGSQQPEVDTHV